ncbi:MAG: hypothetical protein KJ574_00390 [Nanoarchaeota archaeon]|nr:hypothetical protein [Nanoarchaeota archaeon]
MVLNETFNAAVNATVNATANITNVTAPISFQEKAHFYFPIIKERAMALIMAPQENPDMLWIVFPLAVSLFFMTLYFGRYKREELGWNTAFGNSLALLFVAVDLFREIAKDTTHLKLLEQGIISSRLLVPALLFLLAAFLLLSNFFHILPKIFAFFISSALPINLLAYVGIVVVYTGFPFDRITLAAALMLFLIMMILLSIIKIFEPEDWREKQAAMIDTMTERSENRKKGKEDEE